MEKTNYIKEVNRAKRVSGYLNDLLVESLPQKASMYEVTGTQVDKYVLDALGSEPVSVNLRDQPTYEFYLKPKESELPKERLMIIHGSDLRAKIVGGMKNERKYFSVDHFRGNLETAI